MEGLEPVDTSLVQMRTDKSVFVNHVFDVAEGGSEGIAAELQAARLRLESAEDEKAALTAELSSTQSRLHDALEVLEGVLSERSALRRQAQEFQAHLAAAVDDHRSSTHQEDMCASPSAATPSNHAPNTPTRQLRRELLLAQAQLGELRAAQQSWEAERQQMLLEVEEERQRLQEGLAEALTQATSAQREADAAAERASHWCSLAQVLQRSALLTEGASPSSPASCASTSSRYSPTGSACHYSPAASYATALLTASATRSGGARGGASATRLSSDNCSPPTAGTAQSRSRSRLVVSSGTGSGAGGSTAAEVEGSRLITAFHAVAQVPGSAEKQLQGSPVLQHYSSPSQRALAPRVGQLVDAADPATDNASTSSTGDNCSAVAGLAASAELAPGTSLRLLNQLPAPGLSCASSLSMGGSGASPLTPEPHTGGAAGAGAGEQCTPAGPGSAGNPSSRHGPAAAAPGKLLPSAAAALSKSRGAGRSDARASKPGLLGRLLMRSVCAGGLPADRQASAANSGE